jgi:glycosyltransferase involved in cell wall biosynthesis
MNRLLHKSKQSSSDISVVICAYTEKRWDDLVMAIASLHQQTHQPREVIVVIDHNPQLWQRAQAELSNVILLENNEAQGLSGARNCGIAQAQGAIIAFLDDDAAAAPDWLRHLEAAYSQPAVVGVGGAIDPRWQLVGPPGSPANLTGWSAAPTGGCPGNRRRCAI